MMQTATLVFRDWTIATMVPRGEGNPLGIIRQGGLLVQDGRIQWIGPHDKLRAGDAPEIIGEGQLMTPGLIDCHTHLVFAGSRVEDWRLRLGGATYADLARQGRGILSTVQATRAASRDELYTTALMRLRNKFQEGVTTVEIKTGYGLDLPNERKMLEVIASLKRELPLDISATLLAAHAVPPEYAGRADDYVKQVCEVILPHCANLCDAVDVFCETMAFNLEQTERVFRAAASFHKGIKVHAEQLALTGGARLAANLGAWSADHLEYLDEASAQAMGQAGTVATLLPGAYYFLRETQKPPVTLLRKWRVPLAVATDFNPGSSPLSSLLLAANMAVMLFELTPAEALLGITRHAARALRLDHVVGTLEVGKQADLATWNCAVPEELVYSIGGMLPELVVKRGQIFARKVSSMWE